MNEQIMQDVRGKLWQFYRSNCGHYYARQFFFLPPQCKWTRCKMTSIMVVLNESEDAVRLLLY